MFADVKVFPHWGSGELVVSWMFDGEPDPEHTITVFSGLSEGAWTNVTTNGTLDTIGNMFIDHKPVSVRHANRVLYKVTLQTGGRRYDSPSVQASLVLRPHEFAAVRTILARELHNMRVGDGVEALILKPLTFGEPADSFDEETGQLLNPSSDLSGFGERFRGGYFPPLKTYMRFMSRDDADSRSQSGQGVDSFSRVNSRGFAFPALAYRDLVITPQTGERFLVNQVKQHRFRGVVPIMSDIQLDSLPRSDIRYKLDPNNVPTLSDNS